MMGASHERGSQVTVTEQERFSNLQLQVAQ